MFHDYRYQLYIKSILYFIGNIPMNALHNTECFFINFISVYLSFYKNKFFPKQLYLGWYNITTFTIMSSKYHTYKVDFPILLLYMYQSSPQD